MSGNGYKMFCHSNKIYCIYCKVHQNFATIIKTLSHKNIYRTFLQLMFSMQTKYLCNVFKHVTNRENEAFIKGWAERTIENY